MDAYGLSDDELFSCLLNFTWENSSEQVRADTSGYFLSSTLGFLVYAFYPTEFSV